MVGQTYDTKFWKEARRKSLEPGGFGEDRVAYWTKLLNVDVNYPDNTDIDALPEHSDERQIRLDTDRSFVMYGDAQGNQESLHQLLVSIFRRHPSLSYFQGFHDIISVLFLTLPPHLRLPCSEKLSLHRTRDAMGEGLEPVLGLLRFLSKLIAAVDAHLAALLERVSPLPYFALSHLLTMFSHDVSTLPLIQHVFDYLLARPPIVMVYLVAAFVLERKDQLSTFDEDDDGDFGMLHSLLGALPPMNDSQESPQDVTAETVGGNKVDVKAMFVADSVSPLIQDESAASAPVETAADGIADRDVSIFNSTDDTDTDTLAEFESHSESDATQTQVDDIHHINLSKLAQSRSPSPSSSLSSSNRTYSPELETQETNFPASSSSIPTSSQSRELFFSSIPANSKNTGEGESSSPSSSEADFLSDAAEAISTPQKRTPIPLCSLLRAADKLLETYPPYEDYPVSASVSAVRLDASKEKSQTNSDDVAHTSNEVRTSSPESLQQSSSPNKVLIPILASIMGPLSVVYTWSENPMGLPSDAEAEEMVRDKSKVVYPWDPLSYEEDEEDKKEEKESRDDVPRRKPRLSLSRRSEMIFGAGAGAVVIVAIILAMYSNRGARGERLSLERMLALLGAWGAWGWNWIGG